MKSIQKLLALAISLTLAMVLALPAFAADDGSITIQNAVPGTVYKAYRVFDTTYAVDEDGNAVLDDNSKPVVSYTIPENSTISAKNGFDTYFDTVAHGGVTYVSKKSTANDADVIAWLKSNVDTTGNPAATQTAAPGATTVTLSNLAYGYYYITSTISGDTTAQDVTAVTIDTAAPNIEVFDKNTHTPYVDGEDKVIVVNGKETTVTTAEVGSTVTFKVSFTALNHEVKTPDGATEPTIKQITQYTVTDTPDGFAIDTNTISVKVDDTVLDLTNDSTAYSFEENATTGVVTITIPWTRTSNGKEVSRYDSTAVVEITYNATLTKIGTSTNDATISYKTGTDTPIDIPDPDPDPDTTVYSYTVNISKVDSDDTNTKLSGAEFVLYRWALFNDNVYSFVDENGNDVTSGTTGAVKAYYKATKSEGDTPVLTGVTWVDRNSADVFVTDTTGAASISGLAAGKYYLVETKAPKGYNLLEDDTPVELSKIDENTTSTSINLTPTTTVQNSKGSTLPSTGGMGTTIFYVLGGLLVAGAGVLLVTKRRMNGKD